MQDLQPLSATAVQTSFDDGAPSTSTSINIGRVRGPKCEWVKVTYDG